MIQYFENLARNKLVVVAPYGQEINVGSVVENVKIGVKTNGIIIFQY